MFAKVVSFVRFGNF